MLRRSMQISVIVGFDDLIPVHDQDDGKHAARDPQEFRRIDEMDLIGPQSGLIQEGGRVRIFTGRR